MPEDDDERASLLSVWEDAFRDGYESKAAFRRGPCTEAAALCRNFVHAGRYSARRAPVAQWIEQRFPKPHSQPLPASGSNPENPSLPWSSESPLAHASCDPDRRTLVLALYEAGSKSEGSRKCSIHEHAGEFAIRSREKSAGSRRFCKPSSGLEPETPSLPWRSRQVSGGRVGQGGCISPRLTGAYMYIACPTLPSADCHRTATQLPRIV
jgi:hypothetical protein